MRRRGECVRASLALLVALAAAPVVPLAADHSGALSVSGACRDGQRNGAYEVRTADGQTRASGAYAKGRRTGTFLFWSASGSRVALVPYDDDARTGTVTLWYAAASGRDDPPRELEAAYSGDVLHGLKRSWYPNGNPRTEQRYENGRLAEARAWIESGAPLPETDARAMAERDRAADAEILAGLEQFLAENRPPCANR